MNKSDIFDAALIAAAKKCGQDEVDYYMSLPLAEHDFSRSHDRRMKNLFRREKYAGMLSAIRKTTKKADDNYQHHIAHRWKKVAVAVCAFLVIVTMPVFVAAAVNGISPIAVFEKWGRAIFDMPYDTPIEEAGMTFIKNSNVTYYESLEKLLEAEKLDIMYLTWLPDGVTLTEIIATGDSKGRSIVFNYSGEDIYYTVNLHDKHSEILSRNFTDDIVEINGISFYISVIYGRNNAVFVQNGYSYSVTADDRDSLIKLLEGIR